VQIDGTGSKMVVGRMYVSRLPVGIPWSSATLLLAHCVSTLLTEEGSGSTCRPLHGQSIHQRNVAAYAITCRYALMEDTHAKIRPFIIHVPFFRKQ
jgi:hypothetical protein